MRPAMADELTSEQTALLRSALYDLRENLQTQDDDSKAWRAAVELDQQSVGRLSRMDAMQQQAMSEAEARRRQKDLLRIEAAMDRMAEDEYGWCAECGEAVGFARLEIDPMASHCIGCAK